MAADVCRSLGLHIDRGTYMHLTKLAKDEKKSVTQKSVGGSGPSVTLISESGLYKLTLRSDKKQALEFQDWVTRVVLPAIRKDGTYIKDEEKLVSGEMDEDAFVLKAMNILQNKIERLVVERDTARAAVDQYLMNTPIGNYYKSNDSLPNSPRQPKCEPKLKINVSTSGLN